MLTQESIMLFFIFQDVCHVLSYVIDEKYIMANVFHVEFGINDTPLTRALEQGNYTTAERLIVECTNPSYLDEGTLIELIY